MSKRERGRPRLARPLLKLRGTLRPSKQSGGGAVSDGPAWDKTGFHMKLGTLAELQAEYPDAEAMRADWIRRRVDVWKQAGGSLPFAAYYFDRLTARGYEQLCLRQWWTLAAYDAQALRDTLDLLDRDEAALDRFAERDGAAVEAIVSAWRVALKAHREWAYQLAKGARIWR
jgi:hypothetical protein